MGSTGSTPLESEKVNVIIYREHDKMLVRTYGNYPEFEELRKLIGGKIECLSHIKDKHDIYCDEERKSKNLYENKLFFNDFNTELLGNVVVISLTPK
jgi:hypothetical protein